MSEQKEVKRVGCGVPLAVLIGLVILGVIVRQVSNLEQGKPTPTPDPYRVFIQVRNTCGVCGTNSPIGGWEAEDGKSLILSDNGNFVANFTDGTTGSGRWKQDGAQLCLTPSLGREVCYNYQQKIDAMKLDDAIYIRW